MTTLEYNNIVKEFSDQVFGYALKLVKDTETAKDLVQESFIKLWNNREKITTQHAKPFLFRVLFNKMVDDKRKMKRIHHFEVMPEKAVTQKTGLEERDLLEHAFQQLSEKQKRIILLRDWDGYAYEEIAEILGISLSLVKVNLFRARKKMREVITDIDKDFKKKIVRS